MLSLEGATPVICTSTNQEPWREAASTVEGDDVLKPESCAELSLYSSKHGSSTVCV